MKTILIVGGTGFIGYHVAKEAIQQGYKVIILSKNGNINPDRYIFEAKYTTADITDHEILKRKLSYFILQASIDYVINLGGYVNHNAFFSQKSVIDSHLIGLINLIHCNEHIKGFVQVGSSDEYGNESGAQSENQREMPVSSYSFAKTSGSHLIQMLHRENSFPAVAVRIFLTYGPNQNDERFIPQIIKGCLNDSSFNTSLGEQYRDFCHVQDVAKGILSAMTCEKAYGEIINIASGIPLKIKDVVQSICDLIGKGNPLYGKVPYRKDENMNLYADCSKARRILKWSPEIKFNEGILETIKYYKGKI